MSLESLGCLESLVPSKPTLTSNQRLRLHHSSLVLKTENWQHWTLATFPIVHKSTQIRFVKIGVNLWIRFPIPHFIFTRKKKAVGRRAPSPPPFDLLRHHNFNRKEPECRIAAFRNIAPTSPNSRTPTHNSN